MQRLQIELLGGLGGYEAHGRALHGFGDRLRIAEVVLVALQVGSDIAGRHQPGIVAECLEPPAQMMGADAPLHAGRRLASRASSCRRESFRRRTMAPGSLRPTRWNVFLPMSMPRTATVS